jgi:hypothetical protein
MEASGQSNPAANHLSRDKFLKTSMAVLMRFKRRSDVAHRASLTQAVPQKDQDGFRRFRKGRGRPSLSFGALSVTKDASEISKGLLLRRSSAATWRSPWDNHGAGTTPARQRGRFA